MRMHVKTRVMTILKKVAYSLICLASLLIAFGALLFSCQSSLVYFPKKEIEGTPGDVGLEYREVYITTSDGIELHGWYVPAEGDPKDGIAALVCHGNGGNISHRLALLEMLNRLGVNALIFDYRGYGRSSGNPSEEGTYRDARAAWRYLTETLGIPPGRVVVYGRSLGGAIASHLAMESRPGALVLDSAFTSLPDAGQDIYPFLPVRLMSRFDYPTIENVTKVECPILVIHSLDDELIHIHHGEKIFAASKKPKRFVEVSGGHNENLVASWNKYENALRKLILDHLRAVSTR